jgi:pimeloyl-ACP methyl ester carboxylesterase
MEAVEQQHAFAPSGGGIDGLDILRRAREGQVHLVHREGQGDLVVETTGRGEPVVLVHGWGVDRRMWAHQLPMLRKRFRVITYDRRGFGQSTCTADLEQESDDLEAILAYLRVQRVALVGMSQGGRVAIRLASSHPERVSALVLQGVSLEGLVPPPADGCMIPAAALGELVRSGDRNTLFNRLSGHALFDPGPRFTAARAELVEMLRDYRGEDLLASAGPGGSIDGTVAQLGRIKAPTLVMSGSRETYWLRQVADYTARNIRGARRRVIRGGRHFVNMTHIAGYNACLLDFLTRATMPWSERALVAF